ncbi:hypothetical protein NDU88_002977 [Pleurodeles waltl]|uniref:Uncharacterized protein n=1 Tax=Pleurodeles waltl TaxID=8319 RepID=A0AAV7WQ82_PLEWA|nr:hypothetical protein NDU88_002977 [Pleurodeles waltl]
MVLPGTGQSASSTQLGWGGRRPEHQIGSQLGTLFVGCDLEAAEPGWLLRPPDREEELQRRIQATETQRVCGSGLGWTGVTKREQRWAERRPGCRDRRRKPAGKAPAGSNKNRHPPGSRGCDLEAAEPGWPSRPPDREKELQRRIQATGARCACGPRLGRAGVTKREQRWAEVRRAGQQ